jgi:hypothetical protein
MAPLSLTMALETRRPTSLAGGFVSTIQIVSGVGQKRTFTQFTLSFFRPFIPSIAQVMEASAKSSAFLISRTRLEKPPFFKYLEKIVARKKLFGDLFK